MSEQPYLKRYRAFARHNAAGAETVFVDVLHRATNTVRRQKTLPLYLHVRNHSPEGFNHSYGGSGPAQLSLAILIDCLGDEERALGLYQGFKWDFVAKLHPTDAWQITSDEVMRIVERLERESA